MTHSGGLRHQDLNCSERLAISASGGRYICCRAFCEVLFFCGTTKKEAERCEQLRCWMFDDQSLRAAGTKWSSEYFRRFNITKNDLTEILSDVCLSGNVSAAFPAVSLCPKLSSYRKHVQTRSSINHTKSPLFLHKSGITLNQPRIGLYRLPSFPVGLDFLIYQQQIL